MIIYLATASKLQKYIRTRIDRIWQTLNKKQLSQLLLSTGPTSTTLTQYVPNAGAHDF